MTPNPPPPLPPDDDPDRPRSPDDQHITRPRGPFPVNVSPERCRRPKSNEWRSWRILIILFLAGCSCAGMISLLYYACSSFIRSSLTG
jgi:hypothetical protein